MITTLRFDRDSLDPELKDLSKWATVTTDRWEDAKREKFECRVSAIRAYFAGGVVKTICKEHKMPRQELRRHINRCLALHADGSIYGWRGLIPWERQKSYTRRAPVSIHSKYRMGGGAGALSQLFDRYPDLEEGIRNRFYKETGDETVDESRIPLLAILKWFLDACKGKGLTARDYPFCTQSLGRTAIWRYLRRLIRENPEKAAKARFGPHAQRRLRMTMTHGMLSAEKVTRPLQQVQFDGHRIDTPCTILFRHTHGGFIRRNLGRLWLLVLLDVYTRAILGYHISLNEQYSAHDVLLCVKKAITPWKPRTLTIPSLEYAKDAGFPSGIPNLQWALFDEFCYDNAKANLATTVLTKLSSVLGCAINPGPVKTPESRAILERLFKTIEENGFHRLPSTTGGSPQDVRRSADPDETAMRLEIEAGHLEELADVSFARYNATRHSGIGFKAPLDLMQHFADDLKNFIRVVPEDQRNRLGLLNIEITRTVRGSVATGTAPYVDYGCARYRSDVLSRMPELIGTKLRLIVDPEDARCLEAYLPSGAAFGVLTARGFWGVRPHTVEQRIAIHSLKRDRLLYVTETQDPFPVYLKHLATRKDKGSARALAKAHKQEAPRESASQNPDLTNSSQRPTDNDDNVGSGKPAVRRTFTF